MNKTTYINLWAQWEIAKLKALLNLIVVKGVEAATRSMMMLDLSVMGDYSVSREAIYRLKTQFIQDLYKRGFSEEVTLHHQKMICRICGGTGWIKEAFPPRKRYGYGYETIERIICCGNCAGGVYREHILYRFVFKIGKWRFYFYQPRAIVDPLYKVSTATSVVFDYPYIPYDRNEPVELDDNKRMYFFAVVYMYLWSRGIKPDFHSESVSLRRALTRTVKLFNWNWFSNLTVVRRVRRAWEALTQDELMF